MCKFCWAMVVMLLLAVGGMAYKFIIQGRVEQAGDGRLALQLEPAERDLILGEMRAFLASSQQIVRAVINDDMNTVISAARKVGRAAQGPVPGTLIAKLPIEFKKLGFDTHGRFDQLAVNAEQFGDREQALEELATVMENCVACHAVYRIDVVDKN